MKCVVIIVAMCLLASCKITGRDNRWAFYTPRIWHFKKNIPQSNDVYSSAFRAGCNDGMSASGYGGHRLPEWSWRGFKHNYDPDRAIQDSTYKTAYNEGYYYCGTAANSVIGF